MRYASATLPLSLIVLLVLPSSAVEMTSLDKHLPGNLTFYLGIKDKAFQDKKDQTGIPTLLEDPGMQKLIAEFDKWWDETITTEFHLFDGTCPQLDELAFGFQIGLGGAGDSLEKRIEFQAVAAVADSEGKLFPLLQKAVENIQGKAGEKFDVKKADTASGEGYYVDDSDNIGVRLSWGTRDGVTVFSIGKGEKQRGYLDQFFGDGITKNLTQAASHRHSLAMQREGRFAHGWVDLPKLVDVGRELASASGMVPDEDRKKAEDILKHLGVLDIGLITFDSAVVGDAVDIWSLMRYQGKPKGVVDLFTRPLSDGIYRYGSAKNSLFVALGHAPVSEIVDFALETIAKFGDEDPRPGYEEWLAKSQEESGIDAKSEIIDAFGSDLAFAGTASGYTFVLSLADGEKFQATLDKIPPESRKLFQKVSQGDYQGNVMLISPIPQIRPCFGVVGDAFLVSTSLEAWKETTDVYISGTSLADDAWVQKNLLTSGKKPVMFQYFDGNGYVNTMNFQADLAKTFATMAGPGNANPFASPGRLNLQFGPGQYPEGSETYWSSRGLESRGRNSALLSGFIGIINMGRQFALAQAAAERQARRTRTRAGTPDPDAGPRDPEKDLDEISKELENHFSDRGSYPDTLEGLVPDYLDAVPSDPNGSGPYRYYTNKTVYFILAANGPDEDADISVRSYRGGFEQDRAVRGKVRAKGADIEDGDLVRFGPSF